MYYLLTSPEIGYREVEFEKPYHLGYADLYIHDIQLAIELDGPAHFFNNSNKRKHAVQLRRQERNIEVLRFNYHLWDPFLNGTTYGLFSNLEER